MAIWGIKFWAENIYFRFYICLLERTSSELLLSDNCKELWISVSEKVKFSKRLKSLPSNIFFISSEKLSWKAITSLWLRFPKTICRKRIRIFTKISKALAISEWQVSQLFKHCVSAVFSRWVAPLKLYIFSLLCSWTWSRTIVNFAYVFWK